MNIISKNFLEFQYFFPRLTCFTRKFKISLQIQNYLRRKYINLLSQDKNLRQKVYVEK